MPTSSPTTDRTARWPPRRSSWPARAETRRRWPRACSPTTTPSGSPAPRMSGEDSPASWPGPAAASPIRPWKRRVCCCGWSPRSRPATPLPGDPRPVRRRRRGIPSPRLRFLAASRRGMVAALHADLPAASSRSTRPERWGSGSANLTRRACGATSAGSWPAMPGTTTRSRELLGTLRDMGDPHWMVYDAMVAADLRRRRPRHAAGAGNRVARSTLAAMGGPAVGRVQRARSPSSSTTWPASPIWSSGWNQTPATGPCSVAACSCTAR